MATELYDYVLANDSHDGINARVWSPTPWVVSVFTGRVNSDRERQVLLWCRATLGRESYPIHGDEGVWHRGSATVDGWTWFGFAEEKDMNEFVARWGDVPVPTPV